MVTCHLFLQIQILVMLSQWWTNRALWCVNDLACSPSVTSICAHSGQLHGMEACDEHSEILQIGLQCSPRTSQLLPFKLPSRSISYMFPWHSEHLLFHHVDLSIFSSIGHCTIFSVQFPLLIRKDFPIVLRKLRIYLSSSTYTFLSCPAHKEGKGVAFTFLMVSRSFHPATFLHRQLHRARRDQHFVCLKLLTSLSGVSIEWFGLKGAVKIL